MDARGQILFPTLAPGRVLRPDFRYARVLHGCLPIFVISTDMPVVARSCLFVRTTLPGLLCPLSGSAMPPLRIPSTTACFELLIGGFLTWPDLFRRWAEYFIALLTQIFIRLVPL